MSTQHAVSFEEILARGSIRDGDVTRLRRQVHADNIISAEEARALLRLNQGCKVQDPSWASFLIETVTDHLVDEADPQGYLTAANAAWLIGEIGKGGRVGSKTEIELLVNLLDRARWSPESLVSFALEQVKAAVLGGDGPLRAGSDAKAGEITDGEIELIRRIIYAFGGDGSIAITRAEAELLFDINDALAAGSANGEWSELFIKAIANAVMCGSGYAAPPREEALGRQSWFAAMGEALAVDLLEAMNPGRLTAPYVMQSSEERALARLERQRIEIITNEEVTQGEVAWLADRLGRDGVLSRNEELLLAFLRRESPKVDPSLAGLIGRIGKAA